MRLLKNMENGKRDSDIQKKKKKKEGEHNKN